MDVVVVFAQSQGEEGNGALQSGGAGLVAGAVVAGAVVSAGAEVQAARDRVISTASTRAVSFFMGFLLLIW